jgi:hypothetical protein
VFWFLFALRGNSLGAEKRLVVPDSGEADAGTRTPDPLLTMEVLYQLSYVGAKLRSYRSRRQLPRRWVS